MTDPFAAAVAAHQAGHLADAERLYRQVLAADPGHAGAWCNLGAVLARGDRPDAAADCYRRALAAHPGFAEAHFNFGNLCRKHGRLAEAAAQYKACLAASPGHPAAAYNLGLVYDAAGDPAAAADCFRHVTRAAPGQVDPHLRLGDALARAGRFDDAVAAFQQAGQLAPADPRVGYNLGLALLSAGRPAEAEAVIRQALALRPDYPEARNALGLASEAGGRKAEAEAHFREAVRQRPGLADGWSNLAANLCEQGDAAAAVGCLRRAVAAGPPNPAIHSNLLLFLNYPSDPDPAAVAAEHRAWAQRFAPDSPPPPPPAEPRDPDRRLRVGYLSADFRAHTVAPMLEALLRHHDRSQVEVFAYASVRRPDGVTERLSQLADHWRPVGHRSDAAAADLVRADAVDVLVDVGGHTAGNRLLVLARRPAAVQATVFGYPNSTGLAAVDYRLTDALSDPPGLTEALHTERLLRLPEVAWVYVPPADAPAVGPLPMAAGRGVTFASLNNPAKLSDACLAAWAAVLAAVPGSRLLLLTGGPAGERRVADRLAAGGVDPGRAEWLPRLPAADYLAAFGRVDLALDPFPYNGGVSTCDALWMGVPVLTVAGLTYASRQGVGLMTRVGLPEFVVGSAAGLPVVARRWADDPAGLAAVRAGLRDRLAGSAVCDARRYVRRLEDAYRRAWRERLATGTGSGERGA